MHADQLDSDAGLVRRLLSEQFPEWADLPVRQIDSDGTSNSIYRLGDRLAARLPLQAGPAKTEQVRKEHSWLPRFAPSLPLAIPVPLALGEATRHFPSEWTVCDWLEGEDAAFERLDDPRDDAAALASFITALQAIDPSEGPAPGEHDFFRGVPLAERDERTRECIAELGDLVDTQAVTEAWESDLGAPVWDGPPLWIHGDLAPGNLVAREGRLVGVIDWGGLGVGDPATELLPAWNLFEGESREAFRAALAVDDATWARGRGLALSMGLIALPYYLETNPVIVGWAKRLIAEVLADKARGA